MSRSLKKGPFCDEHLMKKVEELNKNDEKKIGRASCRERVSSPV